MSSTGMTERRREKLRRSKMVQIGEQRRVSLKVSKVKSGLVTGKGLDFRRRLGAFSSSALKLDLRGQSIRRKPNLPRTHAFRILAGSQFRSKLITPQL